jgi:phospholipid transport system substrate-binding protein
MKCLVVILCLAGVTVGPVYGTAAPISPEALLRITLERTLSVLKDKDLSLAEKEERINKIVNPVFDFDLMSFLTLGKAQWSKMTPEQRTRFTDLFVAHLKDSYRDKLAMYSDQALVYKPATREGTKIQIPTELVDKDQTVSIVYKMYEKPEQGWKLYDIEVQGVSLVKTYRSQFSEILTKGTIQDLLDKLAESPAQEPTQAPPNPPTDPS